MIIEIFDKKILLMQLGGTTKEDELFDYVNALYYRTDYGILVDEIDKEYYFDMSL